MKTRFLAVLMAGAFSVQAQAAHIVFDFESDTQGTAMPFTDTVGDLSATFTGPGHVCNVSSLGFTSLSGNALIQSFCVGEPAGVVTVSFSSLLTAASVDFAAPGGSMILTAFQGDTSVGSTTFTGTGSFNEGVASFSGAFDKLTFKNTGGSVFALDNLAVDTAVPEPAMLGLFGLGAVALISARRRRG